MADRRLPAVERKIADVSERDIRIRLLGTIIDKQEDFIVLDDGTGKIKIGCQTTFDQNQLIRVLGKVVVGENGVEVQSEFIQNMEKLDLDLLKAVNDIYV
ncbi:MAG: replication protein RepA [Candidatus Aenigmarchaeota archaeon]|nr:replication protein RepA [Candidatus Aenigmarchaeota archaeon]